MKILNFLRKLRNENSSYNPLIKILISKNNLLENLKEYQKKYPNMLIAPVLKSNAYGHGLIPIAKILDKENIPFLIVDSLPEAKILRNNEIKLTILILGYLRPENIVNSKLKNIIFTIISLEQLIALSKIINKHVNINLKIDTGMHRQGILDNQLLETIKIIKNNKFLNLVSISSHLADADNENNIFSLYQIKIWEKVASHFKKEFKTIKYSHLGASAGINLTSKTIDNVARIGIGLYGINTNKTIGLNLNPILEMRSILSSIKTINKNEYVGYNLTYQTNKNTKIATVPLGYFEGVDRRLSNLGYFKIHNLFTPIIGKISMNITSIDVSNIPNLRPGDEVVIISSNPLDKNSVLNIAKSINTIPYEILIHLAKDLKRIII